MMIEHIIAIVFVLTGISLAQIVFGARLQRRGDQNGQD
jgi:hypothetical protein